MKADQYVEREVVLHFDLIQARDHDDPLAVVAEGGPIQLTARTILQQRESRGWLKYNAQLRRMDLETDANRPTHQHVFDALAGVRRAALVTALMTGYDDAGSSVWYWATTPWRRADGVLAASSVRSPWLRRDLRTGPGGGWFIPSDDYPDPDHPLADLAARALP